MSDKLHPLSFAALAASGPLWDKNPVPKELRASQRRCAHCQRVKNLTAFSVGATVCQRCVALNKLRRSKEAKTRYAAKKRQEMREVLRAARKDPES